MTETGNILSSRSQLLTLLLIYNENSFKSISIKSGKLNWTTLISKTRELLNVFRKHVTCEMPEVS